jgi:hypothetical protein
MDTTQPTYATESVNMDFPCPLLAPKRDGLRLEHGRPLDERFCRPILTDELATVKCLSLPGNPC